MAGNESGQFLLTPKNLYRLLTGSLPGLDTADVVPFSFRRGLTMAKFWRETLQGMMSEERVNNLFDCEKRSRQLSDLMNRTGALVRQSKLRAELNAALGHDMLLGLTDRFACFLTNHHYQEERLSQALPQFEQACFEDDVLIPASLRQCLTDIHEIDPEPPGSNAFVPSVAGLIMAGEVIRDLSGCPGAPQQG